MMWSIAKKKIKNMDPLGRIFICSLPFLMALVLARMIYDTEPNLFGASVITALLIVAGIMVRELLLIYFKNGRSG